MRDWANGLGRALRRLLGESDPAILMYHRVAEAATDPWGLAVSPSHFSAQMRELKRRRLPVSLDEMAARLRQGTLEKGLVAVTFDDAYRDVLTHAKPILEELGIPATVFVVTGKLGEERGFWWDRLAAAVLTGALPVALPSFSFLDAIEQEDAEQAFSCHDRSALHLRLWSTIRLLDSGAREVAADEVGEAFCPAVAVPAPVMTEADLRDLISGGLIDVGAHTVTHPSLPSLSADDQRDEIGTSRQQLEAMIAAPVRRLAYPFGDYDERSMAIARELGFDYAVSVEAGPVRDQGARFHLPRYDIKNWTGDEFRTRLRWQI